MKNTLLALLGLTLAAAIATGILLLRVHLDMWRLAALFESLALLLGVFVAFTYTDFIHALRKWVHASLLLAILMPVALLVPYFILAFSTGTFSYFALAKLTAYIAVPTLLLLPNRIYYAEGASWRDFAAMLSLGLPVSAGWLQGIWTWPEDIYIFRPIFCVCVGAYAFLVVRNLKDAGFKLLPKKGDLTEGSINFIAFIILAIPLGLALHFIHPRMRSVSVSGFAADFLGTGA